MPSKMLHGSLIITPFWMCGNVPSSLSASHQLKTNNFPPWLKSLSNLLQGHTTHKRQVIADVKAHSPPIQRAALQGGSEAGNSITVKRLHRLGVRPLTHAQENARPHQSPSPSSSLSFWRDPCLESTLPLHYLHSLKSALLSNCNVSLFNKYRGSLLIYIPLQDVYLLPSVQSVSFA